ncbi:MAG: nucleoside-diphosphate kinase, partial [Thermoplasmatales archaeon]
MKTLILIKPDGIVRSKIGDIISRFENKGLKIVAMKMIKVSREMAEKHY